MSFETNQPLTIEHEAFTALRNLQVMADSMDDPDRKQAFLARKIVSSGIGRLLGSRFIIGADTLFMKSLDMSQGDRMKFTNRITFSGEFTQVSYMYDQEIPVDSLTVVFERPEILTISSNGHRDIPSSMEVVTVDTTDQAIFGRSELQVPVLAIDTCMPAAS